MMRKFKRFERLCREFCATTEQPVPTMKVRWPANRTAAPDAIVLRPSTLTLSGIDPDLLDRVDLGERRAVRGQI
jgi:hypothetical protein